MRKLTKEVAAGLGRLEMREQGGTAKSVLEERVCCELELLVVKNLLLGE